MRVSEVAHVIEVDHLDQVDQVYQVVKNSEAVEPTKRGGRPPKANIVELFNTNILLKIVLKTLKNKIIIIDQIIIIIFTSARFSLNYWRFI
ncbi:hypothetical protein BpHYR1_026820 [Brachionus plicatilis]|uniref:Uncharacterized protein n=1 Tax=Brachionus plicatilis TaxID=10195 RepID=A0A3M7QBR7_BRAPC|nr:hypothetical protein BpHYR1_026820 [Brachionus plicatilis]